MFYRIAVLCLMLAGESVAQTPQPRCSAATTRNGDKVTIQVLVVVTPKGRAEAGPKLNEAIRSEFRKANQVLSSSRMNAELVVAGIKDAAHYEELSTFSDDLDVLKDDGIIARWRDDAKADQVVLIRGEGTDTEGLAYGCDGSAESCPDDAFAELEGKCVTRVRNGCYPYVLVHELAHNWGAGHESGIPFRHDDSHGITVVIGDEEYSDVMGYAAAYDRLPFFSDPNTKCNGVALGGSMRNNARAIREMLPRVARYR